MSETTADSGRSAFAQTIQAVLGQKLVRIDEARGETTIEVLPENWLAVAALLRDDAALRFEQLMDLCGVDYLSWGDVEWDTSDVSSTGFSRGVEGEGPGRFVGPIARVRRISRTVSAWLRSSCRSPTTGACGCALTAPTTIFRACHR